MIDSERMFHLDGVALALARAWQQGLHSDVLQYLDHERGCAAAYIAFKIAAVLNFSEGPAAAMHLVHDLRAVLFGPVERN
jgi:hypothetical protein